MVFTLSPEGALSLQETAVSALGGELRYCDRSFATLFSHNLLEQGFGEAIIQSRAHATPEPAVEAAISEESPMSAFDAQDSEQCRDEPENNPAVDNNLSPCEQNAAKPYPSVQDISLWAMAVRDLALPEPAQRSVQKLYWAVRDGEQPPISPDVWTMRARDVERYLPYRERGQQVLDATTWILAHAGSVNTRQETVFKGNTYEMIQAKTTLTVKKHSADRTEVILQAQDDRITRTTVTPQDVQMFGAFIHHLQTTRTGRSG